MAAPNPSSLVTADPRHAVPVFDGAPFEPVSGMLMISMFANAYAVKTQAGLVMIDSGTHIGAEALHKAVRDWR